MHVLGPIDDRRCGMSDVSFALTNQLVGFLVITFNKPTIKIIDSLNKSTKCKVLFFFWHISYQTWRKQYNSGDKFRLRGLAIIGFDQRGQRAGIGREIMVVVLSVNGSILTITVFSHPPFNYSPFVLHGHD